KGVTANRVYGETLNPWDLTTTPGGSSGGSASAIAARLCNLALATDAGGSTRRPASHVGAVGFKPSQGLIANPDAAPEPNFGNSVIGLITHCVSDLQFLLPYLQGENINDVDSEPASRFPTSGFKTNPELKVGVSPQLGLGFPVDHDVADLFQHTVEQLTPLFGQVTYADPIWPTPLSESFLLRLQFAGLAYLYGDTWKKQPELFDPAIGQQI